MEITYTAVSAQCFGKCYIDSTDKLVVRECGDYVCLKNVDFGGGMKGLEILHTPFVGGTALVEVHLDSPDGKCIGQIACAAMAIKNINVCHGEIEETSGIHDVYLKFAGKGGAVRQFRFTVESPFEEKSYTPVDDSNIIDVQADTWEATDMLGRKIPSPEDCRERREKQVGMFYWTWHENGSAGSDAANITETLEKYPEAEFDKEHHGWGRFNAHWNKPLFGYYRDTDPYIIRKHMIMLAGAGVDFLAFDTTNGTNVMKQAYTALLEGMRNAKLEGINVPKITFIMAFGPSPRTEFMLRAVYQDLYKPGLYEDLWYKIDGKPVVMAYAESIDPENGVGDFDKKLLGEIAEFFTFRPCQPSYGLGPQRPDQWGWLESAPQHKFCERPDGSCEQMTVGTAQNRTADRMCTRFNIEGSFGRSYTNKDGHSLLTKDSYKYGYNFQEQWDNAIAADPDIIFVTGWNEWVAGRWEAPWIFEEGSTQLAFVDQFDREHSRDIEPDCDGYLDTYYLQLCANIRKFKGTAKVAPASGEKTIYPYGNYDQWEDVTPEYLNYRGSTPRRDYPGFGDRLRLVNRTGRNDIVCAKVARNAEKIFFLAKCADDVVTCQDENCMTLFIDIDRNKETGWEGYDFRVCGNELQRAVKDSYKWETVTKIFRTTFKNLVQIAINKEDLGLEDSFDIEFKWSDNNFPEYSHKTPNVMDFYTNGCSAPFGRFNYRYKV